MNKEKILSLHDILHMFVNEPFGCLPENAIKPMDYIQLYGTSFRPYFFNQILFTSRYSITRVILGQNSSSAKIYKLCNTQLSDFQKRQLKPNVYVISANQKA